MQPLSYLKNLQSGSLAFNRNSSFKGKSHVDLDFMLKRLYCKQDSVFILQGEDLDVPPFACKFCSVSGQEHILTIASEEGDILLLDTNCIAKNSIVANWNAHNNAVFDICWIDGESQLITASGDQTLILWDVSNKAKITTFKGHTSSVKSVDVYPGNKAVCASGSRDGSIMIWDVRCQNNYDIRNAETVISDAHSALIPGTPKQKRKCRSPGISINPLNSVTSVLFQDEYNLFSSGAADGIIKVWDLRKPYASHKKESFPKYQMPYSGESSKAHGFTSLVMDPNRTRLYTCCTDSVIYCYSCTRFSPQPVATYYGHKASTYFVKIAVSADGQYLLSGSSDEKVYIWKVSKTGAPLFRLTGHDAEVTAVAWCAADITKIITCGDDEKILLWQIGEEYLLDSKDKNSSVGKAEIINPSDVKRPTRSVTVSPLTPLIRKSGTLGYFNDSTKLTLTESLKLCTFSPSTHLISSKSVSSSITQWFSPNSSHTSNKTQLLNNHTSELKHVEKNIFPNTPKSSFNGKSETLSHLSNKKQYEENLQENVGTVFKQVRSPDENRVLSPSKIYNIANRMTSRSIRRTLKLDDAFSTDKSSNTETSLQSESYKCDSEENSKPVVKNCLNKYLQKSSVTYMNKKIDKLQNTDETSELNVNAPVFPEVSENRRCTGTFLQPLTSVKSPSKRSKCSNRNKRNRFISSKKNTGKSQKQAGKIHAQGHTKKKLAKFPNSVKPITQYFSAAVMQ